MRDQQTLKHQPWSSLVPGLVGGYYLLTFCMRSLVVRDLRSETKGSRFEPGCNLCAEVSSLSKKQVEMGMTS